MSALYWFAICYIYYVPSCIVQKVLKKSYFLAVSSMFLIAVVHLEIGQIVFTYATYM